MIGSTGMIPAPKQTSVYNQVIWELIVDIQIRTWNEDCNLQSMMATDPGLAIAGSIPVHRLGLPNEVSNVVSMFVLAPNPMKLMKLTMSE